MTKDTIKYWHQIIENLTEDTLDNILADDVVFHSPVVHTPQEGKRLTKMYLINALAVLKNDTFSYQSEVIEGINAVLEFTTNIDGIEVNGVDMIRCNDDGKIIDFKVMIRPLQAINIVHKKVGERLATLKKTN
mgnify:CR=1 FL=1